MTQEDTPEIKAKGSVGTGIAVIVRQGTNVLLGRRKGSHAAGLWSFPGGHLDGRESWIEAAHREIMEETGLTLSNVRVLAVANNFIEDSRLQYTTVYLEATTTGTPLLKEPHKCDGWFWFPQEAIPSPHMTPTDNLRALGCDLEDPGSNVTPKSLDFVLVRS